MVEHISIDNEDKSVADGVNNNLVCDINNIFHRLSLRFQSPGDDWMPPPVECLFSVFLHTSFVIFKVTLVLVSFALFTLAVVDEVLDSSDKEYHAKYKPDRKKDDDKDSFNHFHSRHLN